MPKTRSAKHLDDTVSTNSSPDPLALSYDGSPTKAGQRLASGTPVADGQPLQHKSPNTTSPSKLRHSFTPSTPVDARRKTASRSVTLHTPNSGAGASSPWKIRVTVEAEPEDQVVSPSRTRTTAMGRTKITTIPLKGADDSTPGKRRGRPRKTDTPTSVQASGTKRKRPGTPVRPPSQSNHTTSNDQDEPRRNSGSRSDASRPQVHETYETQEHLSADFDPQASNGGASTVRNQEGRNQAPRRYDFDELTPLSKNSQKKDYDSTVIPGPVMRSSKDRVPTPVNSHLQLNFDDMSVFAHSTTSNLGEPDKQFELLSDNGDNCEGIHDDTAVLDRSAVESEGFSMVSIESLRSQQTRGINNERSKQAQHLQTKQIKPIDPAFEAFGEHTQKGLRASLMMGELLARGEKNDQSSKPAQSGHQDISKPHQATTASQTAKFARLPTPSESGQSAGEPAEQDRPASNDVSFESSGGYDAMSWRATTPNPEPGPQNSSSEQMSWKRSTVSEVSQNSQQPGSSNGEATASAAHVTPTDEADPDMVESDAGNAENLEDIWQEEADRSLEDSRSSRRSRSNHQISNPVIAVKPIIAKPGAEDVPVAIPERTPDWNDLLEEDTRPLRAKLPRTWRRVSGNDFLYSDESLQDDEADQADAIEKTPQGVGFSSVAAAFLHQTPHTEPSSMVEITKPNPRPSLRKSKTKSNRPQTDQSTQSYEQYFSSEESSMHSLKSTTLSSNRNQHKHSDSIVDASLTLGVDPTAAAELETSMSVASVLDTSDVRQLKREMNIVIGAAPSSSIDVESSILDQTSHFSGAVDSKEDDRAATQTSTLVAHKPVERLRVAQPAKHVPDTSKDSTVMPRQSFFTRIFSIFWPTPVKPTTDASKNAAKLWTRNHYLLLDRIFQVSQNRLHSTTSKKRKRNSLYVSPTDETYLPSSLLLWVGHQLSSADGKTHMILDESHVRVIHSFIVESREKGVPLMCNGKFTRPRHSGGPSRIQDSFPQRDNEGRIMRIKENWSAEDVVMRLFSLWVADYQP